MKTSTRSPMVPKSDKVVRVRDGQSYRHYKRKDGSVVEYTICCDCSLVHKVKTKAFKRYHKIQVWRDDERTDAIRAQKGQTQWPLQTT